MGLHPSIQDQVSSCSCAVGGATSSACLTSPLIFRESPLLHSWLSWGCLSTVSLLPGFVYNTRACQVHARFFATPWTTAHQAPLSMDFQTRILEWVAISFSRDLPNSGMEPASLIACLCVLYASLQFLWHCDCQVHSEVKRGLGHPSYEDP